MHLTLRCIALCAAFVSLSAGAASCGPTAPIALTVSGSAAKSPGDNLQIDYCLMTGDTVDIYAAVVLPNGSLLYQTAAGSAPSFSTTPAALKSATSSPSSTTSTLLSLTLPTSLSQGTYTFYAVTVLKGSSVTNSANWQPKTPASASVTVSAGTTAASDTYSAFFYQTVAQNSTVRAGITKNGLNVATYNYDLVNAKDSTGSLGDPVFSYLSSGKWAMTAWSDKGELYYYEASCPKVDTTAMKTLAAASTSTSCEQRAIAGGKTSQIFDVSGSNYVFSHSGSDIILMRLSDATRSGTSLSNICVRKTAITTLSDLAWGEATTALTSKQLGTLLVSDTAIARRKNGTWVLFVKGIASDSGCSQGSVCELCTRAIYRTTSTDLVTWTTLEKVVSAASVPEAVTYPDGSVWLYHQNFSAVCTANDSKLALRAPISGIYENADYSMTTSANAVFSGETFETDTTQHYPTNGNPIALSSTAARSALDACMGKTAK